MGYKVVPRRNDNGVTRTHASDSPFSRYWWAEGNAACDCNRDIFWRQAGGETEFPDVPCSEGKYTVVSVIFPDGRVETLDSVNEDGSPAAP